ncbi:MAG TPA: PepSY domain-containing protein, partial [Actinomadura sp.]|nr:PepSY domain-containing protein [Actinomadura sp.]
VPGGRIDSVELEREHGRPVWKVDVLSGGVEHRIQVDARTGAVAREKSKDGGEGGRGRDDARATDDHGRHDRTRTTDDHGRHDRTQVTDDHGGRDRRDDRSEGHDR